MILLVTVMFAILFVEQINLIVQDFYTYKDVQLLVIATAEGFHFITLGVLLVDMLMVVIDVVLSCVEFVEEEGQQDEVVVEVLQ